MFHMQIAPNTTWGGQQEMQLIATRLGVNIQVYTPDPQDATNLISDPLILPEKGRSNITLSIIQDKPTPAEAKDPNQSNTMQIAHQISVLEPNQHRHHYRTYCPPNQSDQKEEKKEDE